MYYGEEIGMVNVPIAPDVQDPAEGMSLAWRGTRSGTPMQWDASPLAGFTTGRPWLAFAPQHEDANVEVEDRDDRSLLNLYRGLIAMRHEHPVLVDGKMLYIDAHENVLRYRQASQSDDASRTQPRFDATSPERCRRRLLEVLICAASARTRSGSRRQH